MSTGTQSERLARIEALIERLIEDVAKIHTEQVKDKEDLAALKNRGAGILIGVSLIAALIGAKVGAITMAIGGIFK